MSPVVSSFGQWSPKLSIYRWLSIKEKTTYIVQSWMSSIWCNDDVWLSLVIGWRHCLTIVRKFRCRLGQSMTTLSYRWVSFLYVNDDICWQPRPTIGGCRACEGMKFCRRMDGWGRLGARSSPGGRTEASGGSGRTTSRGPRCQPAGISCDFRNFEMSSPRFRTPGTGLLPAGISLKICNFLWRTCQLR